MSFISTQATRWDNAVIFWRETVVRVVCILREPAMIRLAQFGSVQCLLPYRVTCKASRHGHSCKNWRTQLFAHSFVYLQSPTLLALVLLRLRISFWLRSSSCFSLQRHGLDVRRDLPSSGLHYSNGVPLAIPKIHDTNLMEAISAISARQQSPVSSKADPVRLPGTG